MTLAERGVGSWLVSLRGGFLGTGLIPIGLFLLIVGYECYKHASRLPVMPWILGDSFSYLEFSDIRPHGYPLMLEAFQEMTGGLRYLPQFQVGLFYASLAALAVAVALRVGSVVAALPVFLLGERAPALPFDGVMSDTIFACLLAFGAAAFFLYQHRSQILWLGAASLLVGAAAACRTTGYVPLACLWVCALFAIAALPSNQSRGLRALFAIVPALLALSIAAGSNLHRNGDFRIGSWGGVSLLGKGLILASPLPPTHPMSRFNPLAEVTSRARATLDEVQDPILKMLITRQYYDYLRWFVAWKMIPDLDPKWRTSTGVQMEKTARDLALAYIRQDSVGYVRLSLIDYGALWFIPRVLSPQEANFLRDRYSRIRDVVFLRTFAQTPDGKSEYYSVVPSPSPRMKVYAIRAGSFLFLALSAVMTIFLIWTRFRGGSQVLDLIFVCAVVHLSYVAIALSEGGFERYVGATWPLLSAAISGIVFRGCQLFAPGRFGLSHISRS
jgi:hypothetical protein